MKRSRKAASSGSRTKRAAAKPAQPSSAAATQSSKSARTASSSGHWTDESARRGSKPSTGSTGAGNAKQRAHWTDDAKRGPRPRPSKAAVAAGTQAVQQQLRAAARRKREAAATVSDADAQHMRRALELAEQYRGRTAPNPIVGCVIVDTVGNVIAEGAHRGPGTKHAEIDALDKLGGKAPGGTLYCNLEPCTHQGRTPPCAPVVATAGLARVVVGSLDPVASHAGGAMQIAKQGIQVLRALEAECDLANLPFRTWALTRQAAFTLKAAITLDGKIATVAGESKWITGDAAREHAHVLRSTHDAVLVGIGTVLADDPQLTARITGGRNPVRVVVDSQLRTPITAKVLQGEARTIIATTERASEKREQSLVAAGAEVWRFAGGQVPLSALGYRLAEESLLAVLVEGGGQIHASLLHAGLATDVQLFIAPKLVGGPAPSWVGGEGVGALADAWQLDLVGEPRRVGKDLLVRAVVRYSRE